MAINGAIMTDFGGYDKGLSVTAQTNGKIIVLGTGGDGLIEVRYNSNGSLDTSFNTTGELITASAVSTLSAIRYLNNGKFLIAGTISGDFAIARYNNDGSLDASFDTDGINIQNVSNSAWATNYNEAASNAVMQIDGKLLVVGYDGHTNEFAAIRFNSDGSVDTGFSGGVFNGDDNNFSGVANCAAVQLDNKIILAGDHSNNFGVMQLSANGVVINTANTDLGSAESVYNATVLTTGKILVIGSSNSNFAAVRYNADLTLDTSFGKQGIVINNSDISEIMSSIVPLANSKFIVAGTNGNYDLELMRYNADGSLDNTFGTGGKVITDLGGAEVSGGLTVQSDGKYLVTGTSDGDVVLIRYNTDGSLDTGFTGFNNNLPTGAVNITGNNFVGQTLTATNTLQDADGLGVISYSWFENNIAITGANNSSYTLTDNDSGKVITVKASYIDDKGNADSAVSLATSAVVGNLTIYGDVGGSKVDTITGSIGNDKLYGLNMNDSLVGNAGDDILYGGYGNDSLIAGEGSDQLYGEQDNDYLEAGIGSDTLDGGLGADTLIGGAGNDSYFIDNSGDVISDNGLLTDINSVTISLLKTYTLPTGITQGAIAAGTTATNLKGNTGNNLLNGNDAKNTLDGSTGRDSLFGGAGDDILIGGTGNDQLKGDGGKDSFKFNSALKTNIDKIVDFSPIDDTIQLDHKIFTKLTTVGILSSVNFITATASADNNDYIIYNKANGGLYYDADGSGTGAAIQIAVIGVNLGITNADFVVV